MARREITSSKAADDGAAPVEKAAPSQILGVRGTAVIGGYVQTHETNQQLVGQARHRFDADMVKNRAVVGASSRFLLALAGRPEWRFNPADKSRRAQEVADSFTAAIADMETPWRRVVRTLAAYILKGYAVSEWVAKRRRDGSIGFRGIYSRPQHTLERWNMAPGGAVDSVVQRDPQSGREITIPRWKLVYCVDDALTDSPLGIGLFRHAADASHRLKRYEQLEGGGYETDLRGVPVVTAPLSELDGIEDAEAEAILAPYKAIVDNHIKGTATGYLIHSDTYTDNEGKPTNVRKFSVDLLRGDSGGHVPIGAAIARVKHELATLFGTQVLLTGATGAGSLALSRQQAELAVLTVEGVLEDLVEQTYADLVVPWGKLNSIPEELLPRPETDSLQMRDVETIAAALEKLETLPANDPANDAARRMMSMPARPIPETVDDPGGDGALTPTIDPDEKDDEGEVEDNGDEKVDDKEAA